MTSKQINSLLRSYADGTISKEDFDILISHFRLTGNDAEILAAMDDIWHSLNAHEFLAPEDVKKSIFKRLTEQTSGKNDLKIKQLKPWYRYAAAVLVVAAGAAIYFTTQSPANQSIAKRYKNDVKPGFEQATLTLANGKVVNLSQANNQGTIQEHGVSIQKGADGTLLYHYDAGQASSNADTSHNTIKTPRGGQFQVVLSDGSHVWLNTASSLTFPVNFTQQNRTVKLTGEAYFEVAKNAKSPFLVITDKQQVKVLGTHFDINAYADEPVTKTTLLEGKVSVVTAQKSTTISPGEQAVFANGNISVKTADLEEAMAWKNGLFLYNQQSLENIMRQVSRWYNVDVVYEDQDVKNQLFSGALSRFKNISEMLEVLETTGSVHFKIEGRRVTVMQ
ncbi:FecR domain-containing protein [uncultured Mucilaginibacter sp.]|uniref:FecR family protein n=1 Tax=uncultured Mucilaginibacter sp. TaxID=797541 RepID=UPI0025FBF518|nr:FecR domain-containing protein [uncultured Mucilaginibacter sp.]